ncbi:ketopantoate reductase family protein [Saccharospirillum mangrovi]|uniref:ketopantoate reductase family protein n=1 Tax=Saccharospirillum mangrovi TaxID=2161747 RepID=UPI001964BF04|nr:2-dehydropantoate 2-reductase [Saccharospirillum mangrovi]
MKNLLFIGPGAIGSVLCWHWQPHVKPWVFPHRPDMHLATALLDADQSQPLHWQRWPDDRPWQDIDLVVVTTKAHQVMAAVTPLLDHLPQASWLLCCNGLGAQQWLAQQAPNRVLWASTTEGVRPMGDGRMQRSGSGLTLLGPASGSALNAATQQRAQLLLEPKSPLTLEWRDDLLPTLWLKLAVNAVINPLTAWHGLRNGELLDAQWRTEIETLCAEIQTVARACQQILPNDLVERVLAVATATAHNHSSMRLDVEAGRHNEIDFINGYLVRQGYEAGVKTPRLALWQQRLSSRQPPS